MTSVINHQKMLLLLGVAILASALSVAFLLQDSSRTSANAGYTLNSLPAFNAVLRTEPADGPSRTATLDYDGRERWTWTEVVEDGETSRQSFDGRAGTLTTWNSGRDYEIVKQVGDQIFIPPTDWFADGANLRGRGYERVDEHRYRGVMPINCTEGGPADCDGELIRTVTLDPEIGLPTTIIEEIEGETVMTITLQTIRFE